MPITEAQFKKIALSFPEAHEKSHYGSPSIMVAKKFFARFRKEDASVVWIVDSIDERDNLIEMDPKTYFITDHYKNYPSVLVRVARLNETMLKKMLERRWRAIAPKKLIRTIDEARDLSSPATRASARGGKGTQAANTKKVRR